MYAELFQMLAKPITMLLLRFRLDGSVEAPRWRPKSWPKELTRDARK